MECLEHRTVEPDVMYEAYTTGLESFESSGTSPDSGSFSLNQSETISDRALVDRDRDSGFLEGETRTAVQPKRNRQPTQIEVNQNRRPILVSGP